MDVGLLWQVYIIYLYKISNTRKDKKFINFYKQYYPDL